MRTNMQKAQHLCLFILPMWKNIKVGGLHAWAKLRRNTLVVGYLSSTSNVYVARPTEKSFSIYLG